MGPGRGQGRGRGGGRQFRFASRMMEPALLAALINGDQHGYSLLEKLEKMGLEIDHPSMVYRSLRALEENGLVASDWDETDSQGPPRRVYTLTPEGRDLLPLWKNHLQETQAMITNIIDQMTDG
jgi:DNA-binding PadR family transcriptional regulator